MPQEIILLTSTIEACYLAGILSSFNPDLSVVWVRTREELERAVGDSSPSVRLIAFMTEVVVPAEILKRLEGPAYNFHPGPPAYPGKYPSAFALYDGAAGYGATAHEMRPLVDSGPIVGALEFAVPPDATYEWLRERTYTALIQLFLALAPKLATSRQALTPSTLAWGARRCTQKAAEALCRVTPDIDADELRRRVRGFSQDDRLQLRISLHGREFLLVPQ